MLTTSLKSDYRIGSSIVVDVDNRKLIVDSRERSLRPQCFDALLLLMEYALRGDMVPYDVFQKITPDGSDAAATGGLSDESLRRVITDIRKVVGSGIIDNISKKGYKLVAPISSALTNRAYSDELSQLDSVDIYSKATTTVSIMREYSRKLQALSKIVNEESNTVSTLTLDDEALESKYYSNLYSLIPKDAIESEVKKAQLVYDNYQGLIRRLFSELGEVPKSDDNTSDTLTESSIKLSKLVAEADSLISNIENSIHALTKIAGAQIECGGIINKPRTRIPWLSHFSHSSLEQLNRTFGDLENQVKEIAAVHKNINRLEEQAKKITRRNLAAYNSYIATLYSEISVEDYDYLMSEVHVELAEAVVFDTRQKALIARISEKEYPKELSEHISRVIEHEIRTIIQEIRMFRAQVFSTREKLNTVKAAQEKALTTIQAMVEKEDVH